MEPAMSNRTKVYSYLRFSTPEQKQGDSYRRQDEERREWIERNGYEYDARFCFEDEGISSFRGRHAEEGELGIFLKMVKAKEVRPGSILLIERLDRFSREQPLTALLRLDEIVRAGIEIVTLRPERRINRESVSNMSLMEVVVALTLSHEESAKKRDWAVASWKGRRKKIGERNLTGVCPSWLQPVKPKGFDVIES